MSKSHKFSPTNPPSDSAPLTQVGTSGAVDLEVEVALLVARSDVGEAHAVGTQLLRQHVVLGTARSCIVEEVDS